MWLEALVQRYSRVWTEQHPSWRRTTRPTTALLQCGKPFWPCRHGFSGRGRAHTAASTAPIPTIHRDTKVSITCVPVQVWALAVNCPRSHDTRCKHRHSIVFVKKQTNKQNYNLKWLLQGMFTSICSCWRHADIHCFSAISANSIPQDKEETT